MTEKSPGTSGDAKQDDSSGLDPELQKAALKLSLEEWQRSVLDDDDLYEVIVANLKEGNDGDGRLTEFSLAPRIELGSDKPTLHTLGIIESASSSHDVTEVETLDTDTDVVTTHKVGIGFGFFKDIDVAYHDAENNRLNVHGDFIRKVLGREDIASMDDMTEEEFARAAGVASRYMKSVFGLFDTLDARGVDWGLHPLLHTPITMDELGHMGVASDVQ